MAHSNPALSAQQQQILHAQKRRQFLHGLASMHSRSHPLPPELAGVAWPAGYDPSQSPWKPLDISRSDIGIIRLAGKDVDLYKLWAIVLQGGGGAKVDQQGLWPNVLRVFELPDVFPEPQPNGQQSVAATLQRYYSAIIGPFEEAYRRNVQQNQQARAAMLSGRMQADAQQGIPGGSQSGIPDAIAGPSQLTATQSMAADSSSITFSGMSQMASSQSLDAAPGIPGLGQMSPTNPSHTPQIAHHSPISGMSSSTSLLGGSVDGADAEAEMRKRKLSQTESVDSKRARQKTGSSDGSDMRASVGLDRGSVPPSTSLNGHTAPAVQRSIRQPSRRKIEYVPLARELETTGGRDLDLIQKELLRAAHRPLKDMNEWGQVDVEALTMSLRSRISTELSYALTTFTMLTLMRYSHKEAGFPIAQAPDLLEEVLDLLEDVGLDGMEDDTPSEASDTATWTHRELVNFLVEDGARPFAGLEMKQGMKDPDIGPRPRHGDTILAAVNILRNLSSIPDNLDQLAKHDRFVTIILKLCSLAPSKPHTLPKPASTALSLQDLLTIRKDVLNILVNIAGLVDFTAYPSEVASHNVRRAFELLSSFLTDPIEAVSPFACMLLSGIPPAMHQPKPPSLADTTLEVFTRLFQPDENRRLLSTAVPPERLFTFVEALVHRLPVSDNDFQVVMRDVWLGYVEKIVMALYAFAFLLPPQLKKRIKTDRRLGFAKVLLRLVKKFTIYSPPDARMYFVISVRRAIAAMRLIDDAADSFDTSQSTTGPTLMFGMGYGEHGDTGLAKGMGMLSGYQDEITWGLMMQRDVAEDKLMFSELESLVRVDKVSSSLSV